MGSPETKWICWPLLEKSLTNLELSVHESGENSLIYPPYDAVQCKEKLGIFVEKKELTLRQVDASEKQETFDWLMSKSMADYDILRLSNEGHLVTNIDLSHYFRTSDALQSLREIYLDNCSLFSIPNMSSLLHVEIIDVSDNNIRELDEDFLSPTVKELCIKGNPIEYVKLTCDRFPNLRQIRCGSKDTLYISSRIVQRLNIEVIIPDEYKQYLCMPPPEMFEDDENRSQYINNPEKYLLYTQNVLKRSQALTWLIFRDKFGFRKIDFTHQEWLFQKHFDFGINHFHHVTSLTLDKCSLTELPSLAGISSLQNLSLCENNLKYIPNIKVPSLEILDVNDNPIVEIDFEVHSFPKLALLTFGSWETRYVSLRVLNRSCRGELILCVPAEHRERLSRPMWADLEKNTSLMNYISCTKLDVSNIVDFSKRWEVIQWVLEKNEKIYTSFSMPSQMNFCRYLEKEEDFALLFRHPSLNFVTEIYLSNCALSILPEWNSFGNLEYAYLDDNNLSSVPSNKSLKVIDISRNPIERLFFVESEFPKLRQVIAGSDSLHYISSDLLKRATVSVDEEYGDNLVMPPFKVLNEDDTLVERYLITPEKFLIEVEDGNVDPAVEWLFNEDDVKFTELDLSSQYKLFRDPHKVQHFLQGSNLTAVTSINLSRCELDYLPQIKHLGHLDTFEFRDNYLADLSCVEHSKLRQLDVTGNPIKIIDVDFTQCPLLESLAVGSSEMNCLSVQILQRLSQGDFNLHLDEEYKENIIVPPPHLVVKDLHREEISTYLNSGEFNISWYMSDELRKSENPVNHLLNILSLDKRKILRLRMTRQKEFFKTNRSRDRYGLRVFKSA